MFTRKGLNFFSPELAFFTNYQVKFALMSAFFFFFFVCSMGRLQISFFNKYNFNIASAFPLYTYLNHLPLFLTPFHVWYAHNPLPLLEDYKDYHDIRNSSLSHIFFHLLQQWKSYFDCQSPFFLLLHGKNRLNSSSTIDRKNNSTAEFLLLSDL